MKIYRNYFLLLVFTITTTCCHAQEKIVVQYFLHTTCPISQKYSYVINQIAEKYSTKPIHFELVFLNIKNNQEKSAVVSFIKKYQLKPPYKIEPNTNSANELGVKVTPEVVVLKGSEKMYQGAIDDWYVSWGKNKKTANQHYLIDAIDALLLSQPVKLKKTNAIGCLIETTIDKIN